MTTRHRVGGLLVDSCDHTHNHDPHQWVHGRGPRHCPGHPAPAPADLARQPGHRLDQMTDDDLDALHEQLATVRADNQRMADLVSSVDRTRQLQQHQAGQQLAEAQRRITTLEHVASGNKRHVQMLTGLIDRVYAVEPDDRPVYGDRSQGYRDGWNACRDTIRAELERPDQQPRPAGHVGATDATSTTGGESRPQPETDAQADAQRRAGTFAIAAWGSAYDRANRAEAAVSAAYTLANQWDASGQRQAAMELRATLDRARGEQPTATIHIEPDPPHIAEAIADIRRNGPPNYRR